MNKMKKIMSIAAVVFLCGPLAACGEVVETGERGVKTNFGEVVSGPLPEGLYFYNPITTTIHTLDTKTKVVAYTTHAYTKDVQQASVKFTVNYRLDASQAHTVFKEVGRDWENKLLSQILEGSIKEIIGQWDAVDLIENRQKAARQVFSAVEAKLTPRHIILENFELNNVEYAGEFEKAVEAKVTAIQRAAEAKNKTIQVEEEAKQKVIAAKAEAESMRIRSAALSQNQNLVEYEAVMKWDGVLPKFMTGSGSVPFINIDGNK